MAGLPPLLQDRRQAGALLARALEAEAVPGALVVGLARGGVVVAAAVATALGLPLEALAVRKVTHPWQPEYALGAVAAGAAAYVRESDGLTGPQLSAAVARARADADALDRRLRLGDPDPGLHGRRVLLVDDGFATGATMVAAVTWARERGAARIVAAAPVGAGETVAALRRYADDVVCLRTPEDFGAVGTWYADFPQVDDATVRSLLQAGRLPAPAA